MATNEELAALRRMVDEPTTDTYSDEALLALIDGSASLDAAAAQVWREKAAAASTYVNVSESGSSRSMQQVHQNSLAMAEFYGGRAGDVGTTADVKDTYPIERL